MNSRFEHRSQSAPEILDLPQADRSRSRRLGANSPAAHWLMLALALLILGGTIAWHLVAEYRSVDDIERERLANQARIIKENLGRQLRASDHVLDAIRVDPMFLKAPIDTRGLAFRLQAMARAVPGMRTLLLLDADGNTVASNREESIGQNYSERQYFQIPRKSRNPATLHVTPPYINVSGVYTMTLSKAIVDDRGEFAGVAAVTLAPDYFKILLDSVRYAPDMWTGLAHANGTLFMLVPERPGTAGVNLARPGSLYTRHRDSGQEATTMTGVVYATGEERMVAQRTILLADPPMDQGLLVAVSRDLPSIFAAWREDALIQAGMFLVLALASILGLYAYQRRQRAYNRLSAAHELERRQAQDALKFSEGKFRKAFYVNPDSCTISRLKDGLYIAANRGFSKMLGYAEDEVIGHTAMEFDIWQVPEERKLLLDRLRNTGEASDFEVRFRARDGTTRTGLLSAVLLEIEGDTYMLSSTHDVTARRQVEKALRESEERYRSELEKAVLERTGELTQVNEKLVEESGQRIKLERAMLDIAEEERSRLGRELHDGLGQVLTATAFMAQGLSQDLESEWEPGAAQASAIERHLSAAVEKARLLAQGLMPLSSQVGSISVALEQLAQHARESYRIEVRVVCDAAQIVEDRQVAQELYLTAQEALLNAVKHGHASCVTIEFLMPQSRSRPEMRIIDNGVGLDQERISASSGVGVRIMRQRCRSIGLELTLEPHPGGGTVLRVN